MKTGRYRLKAVILGRMNYSEADLIVPFFTREYGMMSGLAKHGRKSVKRFGNVLEPGSLVELDLQARSGRDLVLLERGELLWQVERACGDIKTLTLVAQGLELVGAFCAPLDSSPDMFDLLVWYLDRLERNERIEEAAFFFKIKLLSQTGFGPNLTGCGICGKPPGGNPGMFRTDHGGWVCPDCGKSGFRVDPGTVKTMSMVQAMTLARLNRARVGDDFRKQADTFLHAYIRHVLGRELKSVKFFDAMNMFSCPGDDGF